MATVTHKVVKGDTLSELAVRYGTTVAELVRLNDISNPDLIYVDQELVISGTAAKKTTNTTYRATIKAFGLQSNTENTLFAIWVWDKANTEKYQIRWKYKAGGVWFYTSTSYNTVDENDPHASKQSTYTIPSNATCVSFEVLPICKKKENSANGSGTVDWTAKWSLQKYYYTSNLPPKTPGVPSVEINKYTLTARLDNIGNLNASKIEFQVIKDDASSCSLGTSTIKNGACSYTYKVTLGSKYKVRCRSVNADGQKSDWSNYSANVSTIPSAPASIITCRANSKSTDNRISVYLEWSKVSSATSYDIEYSTNKDAFDISDDTTKLTGIETDKYEIYSLDPGSEYFFRVRAVNNVGTSEWSSIASVILGRKPAAPTTWSSANSVVVGEPLNLYWVHNSEDGSSQTWAQLEVYVNDILEIFEEIKNSTNVEDKDKTSVYSLDTTDYEEGAKVQWRVRTAGVTSELGDWSIQRTIDIYAPPTFDEFSITDSKGNSIEELTSFPFYVKAVVGPASQAPTGYHLSIVSNETYETVDSVGNEQTINEGEMVYSRYFDISTPLLVEFTPGNINLDNNISYTITCTVSMNSGLTAEASIDITVAWTDLQYEPNAEIGIDEETCSAFIRPYCEDENGDLIENITLSVFRREFDGSFIELATDIANTNNTFFTDPHPSLDYARYRVVATDNDTGAISFYDVPGYPVNGKSVIIQWDEKWLESFDAVGEDPLAEPTWSGSMLKLLYNIDVSDSNRQDVELVEYIGRKHPVSYYGTQIGEASTWNVVIDKSDTETLYALRRLSMWMGDVYVREPSGSGYWANISISFSQKHLDLTIPVTIQVTRVEGGI